MLAELPELGPFSIEHPESLLATLIGFLLLALLLWFVNVPVFSRPYLRGILNERATRIGETHRQVDRAIEDMQRVHDDYAARIRDIETEARLHIDQAVREADAARTDIIADAQQAAEALRRRSEEELARERTRQRILFRRQIVQIALDSAEEAVVATNSEAVQRQLINDFITRAGSDGARAAATIVTPAIPTAATAEEA